MTYVPNKWITYVLTVSIIPKSESLNLKCLSSLKQSKTLVFKASLFNGFIATWTKPTCKQAYFSLCCLIESIENNWIVSYSLKKE